MSTDMKGHRRKAGPGSRPLGRVDDAPMPRVQVEKTYHRRLPVSGQEPPVLTAYERRRAARKTAG